VKTELTLTAATALAVLALLPGCGDADRPATWAYISPVILQPNCATGSCHSPAAAVDGLDFSTPDTGYSSLTRLWSWVADPSMDGQAGCGHASGTIVCEKQFRPLVTPYDPSQSRLVSVLRGRDAPRMPPDRPLDEADIRLVERWILNGAHKGSFDADAAAGADGKALDAASDGVPQDTADAERGDGGDASALDGASGRGPEASGG
jgi:hypothetical protein